LLKDVEQHPRAKFVQMLRKMAEPLSRRAVGQGAKAGAHATSFVVAGATVRALRASPSAKTKSARAPSMNGSYQRDVAQEGRDGY
jgi:hypothetical protein